MKQNNLKIKLAAIARDEAAYLPEWIFHHIDFGFDEIEIYINNTSDNSLKILNNIKANYPVIVTDANKLFESSDGDFQLRAYRELTKNAMADGFSHIMFLDIDEFWTPVDFKTTVKEAITSFNYPQALSLNWMIHSDEDQSFSRCFTKKFNVRPNIHVKTLFQLDGAWREIREHNIVGENIKYTKGNGQIFDFGDSPHCAHTDEPSFDHKFFVIHRMYRSQLEYISLLGRGRANKLKLKDNRSGYYKKDSHFRNINIDESLLFEYNERFDVFMLQCNLQELLQTSHDFIFQRYKKVITWAKKANDTDAIIFYKLFKGIQIPEVLKLREKHEMKIELLSASISLKSSPSYSYLWFVFSAKILNELGLKTLAQRTFLRAGITDSVFDTTKILPNIEKALIKTGHPLRKHADIYREIAIIYRKQKNLPLAYTFIAKAKECRPDGERILRIYNEIIKEKEMLNNK